MAKYKLTINDEDNVLINLIPAQPEDGYDEGTKVTVNVKFGPVGNLFGSIDGGDPVEIIPKAVFEVTMDSAKTVTLTKQSESSVATPVITPNGGDVDSGATVEITCATEGATIYYTTDGSTPTTDSTEYTEAIEITEAVTIKAIAILDEDTSEVASASFTIKVIPVAETPTISTDLPATAEIPAESESIDLTIVASVTDGGTLSYAWTKDGTEVSSAESATFTVTGAGTYQCTVTNTLGEDTATAQSTACVVTKGV